MVWSVKKKEKRGVLKQIAFFKKGDELKYKKRKNETFTVNDAGIVYTYHDKTIRGKNITYTYKANFDKMTKYEFCDLRMEITLHGDFKVETFVNGFLEGVAKIERFSFLDVFERGILSVLEKYNIPGEDIDIKFPGDEYGKTI